MQIFEECILFCVRHVTSYYRFTCTKELYILYPMSQEMDRIITRCLSEMLYSKCVHNRRKLSHRQPSKKLFKQGLKGELMYRDDSGGKVNILGCDSIRHCGGGSFI